MKILGRNIEQARLIADECGLGIDEYVRLTNTRVVGKFCIRCMRRIHTVKGQYCLVRPSSRSENGYKTVKAHDDACGLYKERSCC